MFNAQNRIRQLMNERGWTIYRLAQESGLSQTTISNIFKRNNQPSLPTVNAICDACGITLAQFFTENDAANGADLLYGGKALSGVRACRGHQEVFAHKMRAA